MNLGPEYKHLSPAVEYYRSRLVQEARLVIAFYQSEIKRSIPIAKEAFETVVKPWLISLYKSNQLLGLSHLLEEQHVPFLPITDIIIQKRPVSQIDELRRFYLTGALPFLDHASFLVTQRNGSVSTDDVLAAAKNLDEEESFFALGHIDWVEKKGNRVLFGRIGSSDLPSVIPRIDLIPREIIAFSEQIKSGGVTSRINELLAVKL